VKIIIRYTTNLNIDVGGKQKMVQETANSSAQVNHLLHTESRLQKDL
jgi:hypothetical protein